MSFFWAVGAQSRLAVLVVAAWAAAGAAAPARAQSAVALAAPAAAPGTEGVLRLASKHSVEDTVARIKAAVLAKGIHFFAAIDQAQLAKEAGLPVPPSTLVLFGNPPLGVQFLQSNPYAGLDWPVRMLVVQAADGSVSVAWTDFAAIGRRYRLANRAAQLKMASIVAAGIATEAAN